MLLRSSPYSARFAAVTWRAYSHSSLRLNNAATIRTPMRTASLNSNTTVTAPHRLDFNRSVFTGRLFGGVKKDATPPPSSPAAEEQSAQQDQKATATAQGGNAAGVTEVERLLLDSIKVCVTAVIYSMHAHRLPRAGNWPAALFDIHEYVSSPSYTRILYEPRTSHLWPPRRLYHQSRD